MKRRYGTDKKWEEQQRLRMVHEAARLMAQDGIRDFSIAKRKAAERLGVAPGRHLPGNDEIERELIAYHRLFHADSQPRRLRELRQAAVQAMRLLEPFRPRLVGPVLSGAADQHSPIHLHLFADTAEEVALFLMEQRIPYETGDRMLRVTAERQQSYPLYRFIAGDISVELTVFPPKGLRQPPLSPVDGHPMRRADRAAVEALAAQESGFESQRLG